MNIRRRATLAGNVLVFAAACLYVIWSCSLGSLSEELSNATLEGDYSRMQLLLKLGADPNFKFDDTTPILQGAINMNDARATAILVEHGGQIEFLDSHYQRLAMAPKFHQALEKEIAELKRRR